MRPLGERAADLRKRRAWGTLPSGGDRRRPTSTDRFTGVSPELAAASKPSKLHSLAHRALLLAGPVVVEDVSVYVENGFNKKAHVGRMRVAAGKHPIKCVVSHGYTLAGE